MKIHRIVTNSDGTTVASGFFDTVEEADAFTEAHKNDSTPTQTSEQARTVGETYVGKYFTSMQLQRLSLILLNPSTPVPQMEKVLAVLDWLNQIEAAWITSPATFNPATFAQPPFTYEQVIAS